jgi:glycine dehydrogenase subunit 2
MKLIFEISRKGRRCVTIPELDVPSYELKAKGRQTAPALPEVAEVDLVRHYMALSRRAHGVDTGFYPLGSCTMKYNPRVNEETAALAGFTKVHPLQPAETVRGCVKLLGLFEQYLAEISGMDAVTLQPAAGAHGEFTGIMLIKKYHESRKDACRTKIIVPDSAHGTNPASAKMNGYEIVSIPSGQDGNVDLEQLKAVVGSDTAGMMLTNPSTLGLFEPNILEISKIVHGAGGLMYYDGANLNAVMGIARPGDMGFDVIHINVHKTFSTPHGAGGPGAGPVGCKAFLKDFLPVPFVAGEKLSEANKKSIGRVKTFYGNFTTLIKGLTYIITLGAEGLKEASECAVLNANYLREQLVKIGYNVPHPGPCMHEFVVAMDNIPGVGATDVAKALLDDGIHPPTMYFPLIVHEALMIEPTETESIETLDDAIAVFEKIFKMAKENPAAMKGFPKKTPVGRLDDVKAARTPIVRWKAN